MAPAPISGAPAYAEKTAKEGAAFWVTTNVSVARRFSPEREAAALFDEEVDARRRGDDARVLVLHQELQARHPSSGEAHTSRATVGRFLLDHQAPASALENFDAYLATGSGDLREEAMIGRAMALERLGRRDDACRAWEALVGAFPRTPYAAHAEARIESSKSPD
jgi:hypothetical protein